MLLSTLALPSRRLLIVCHTLSCLILGCLPSSSASAQTPPAPLSLTIAPGTLRPSAVTVVWDKPESLPSDTQYQVSCDQQSLGKTQRGFLHLNGLLPGRTHTLELCATSPQGQVLARSVALNITLPATGTVLSVKDLGAKGDGKSLDTAAIQAAIDRCPAGGTVLLPPGNYLSGALFLKSDMTLEIGKGATLQGSENLADYGGLVPNRFEGWEMETYSSLLNAGKLDRNGSVSVKNLHIIGEGRLAGGGAKLGNAMIAAKGLRSRGRLICLMNCENVEIQGLRIENPPSWTIHYIYSKNISCEDLDIHSKVRNGDGLDPDSSVNSYILNCSFDTGDDCIAIKSGKNPEGNVVDLPTIGVRILGCRFTRGHGISIGSEMSGGVRDVLVQDCQAGPLINGLQIKGTPERGGFVEDVVVRDCDLQKITVLTKLNYNNDGAAAPHTPLFRRFSFSHIDLSKADAKKPVIIIQGFSEPGHRSQDIRFDDILLPSGAAIELSQAERLLFTKLKCADGQQPSFHVKDCSELRY